MMESTVWRRSAGFAAAAPGIEVLGWALHPAVTVPRAAHDRRKDDK
jgi:hypothetical protein